MIQRAFYNYMPFYSRTTHADAHFYTTRVQRCASAVFLPTRVRSLRCSRMYFSVCSISPEIETRAFKTELWMDKIEKRPAMWDMTKHLFRQKLKETGLGRYCLHI